jgi:hypothetical protein
MAALREIGLMRDGSVVSKKDLADRVNGMNAEGGTEVV